MLEATIRRFRRDKRGISNVVVAVLSLILIVMIVGNVILWSYDMNQLDWEKMQERISLVNGQTGLTSPWFVAQNEFQTEAGTQTRGSFVQTQTADGNFESFEEGRAETAGNAELAFVNQFKVDTAKYPASAIAAIQIQIAYRVNSTEEKWYLTAFNWSSSSYSNLGFNCSSGNQPVLGVWNEYDANVTDSWRSYLRSDGTVRVRFNDEATSNNETLVDIDFLGVNVRAGGFSVEVRNSGPLTVHIIAVWLENTTLHQRFHADAYVNSADEATLALVNGELPEGNLSFRIVTERGNEAVSSLSG